MEQNTWVLNVLFRAKEGEKLFKSAYFNLTAL